jgi:hypothetical protein
MKKILLFIVLPLLMQSCLFEDNDYFEESASARVEGKISETKNILSSASNGWILHYFPDLSYGGHNYALSFSDKQATISCETEVVGTSLTVGDPASVDSCLYDVIPEQGAILTFNTYSKLLHQFRNPSAAAYQGLGGDYEFILTDIKQNEIKLKGKTTGNLMRMFPVPSGYTKESYLEAIQAMSNKGKLGNYTLYYEGKVVSTTVGARRGRYLSYTYNETVNLDTISTTATISLIYTLEGFIVYHDKLENVKRNVDPPKPSDELVDFVFDSDKEYTEFIYDDANSKFVSKDGKIEFVKIPLVDLNTRIVEHMQNTSFDYYHYEGSASPTFNTIWNNAKANLAAAYGSIGVALSDMNIGYDWIYNGANPCVITFWCGPYNTLYGLNITPVTGTVDQISISSVPGTYLNWSPFGPYLNPLLNFFVNNSPWIIEPNDIELPERIKLINVSDPNIWVFLDIY